MQNSRYPRQLAGHDLYPGSKYSTKVSGGGWASVGATGATHADGGIPSLCGPPPLMVTGLTAIASHEKGGPLDKTYAVVGAGWPGRAIDRRGKGETGIAEDRSLRSKPQRRLLSSVESRTGVASVLPAADGSHVNVRRPRRSGRRSAQQGCGNATGETAGDGVTLSHTRACSTLHLQEEKARLVVCNAELSARLELALSAMQVRSLSQRLPSHGTTVAPNASSLLLSTRHSPLQASPVHLGRAKSAGQRRRLRQLSVPRANLSVPPTAAPIGAKCFDSPLATREEVASSRPATGHVRDSELLRALQAAERRAAFLEAALATTGATPWAASSDKRATCGSPAYIPEATGHLLPFDPLMPSIIVIPEGDEEDEEDAEDDEGVVLC